LEEEGERVVMTYFFNEIGKKPFLDPMREKIARRLNFRSCSHADLQGWSTLPGVKIHIDLAVKVQGVVGLYTFSPELELKVSGLPSRKDHPL